LSSVQAAPDIAPDKEPPKEKYTSKPLSSSKFNSLSTSLTFAVTGLVVIYLPDILNKSINWRVEGRWLGIILALIGTGFALAAAAELTGRSGFGYWGFAIILGTVTGGIMLALHSYHLPKWAAVILTLLAVNLMVVVIYALVSGFTIFFDEPRKTSGSEASGKESSASSETGEEKKLSWYERITLIIAVISAVATIAAAIEPVVHP
jgi:MFS family permease